jgi:hypothetical protein
MNTMIELYLAMIFVETMKDMGRPGYIQGYMII